MKKHSSLSKAFSLVELSVVIIIVGILIAGVTQGTRLIDEGRLKTARALTNNSRINSMEGLVLWYETSLVSSFSKTDAVDGATISQWNDINPQSTLKLHAKAGQKTDSTKISYNVSPSATAGNTSGPTYIEDGVNHLPTLRFTNVDTTKYNYVSTDAGMRNFPQDSMIYFVVMQYRGGSINFISRSCVNSDGSAALCSSGSDLNPQALFNSTINSDGTFNVCARPDSGTSFASIGSPCYTPTYTLVNGRNYILTFERDYGRNFIFYINGSSSYANSTKADSGEAISVNPFKIGRNVNADASNTGEMDVSEFIFFAAPIKKRDRWEIENYLGKKYNIPVVH